MTGRELREKAKIFDGTYTESRGFLISIRLHLRLNDVHDQSLKVIITLNRIRGERVDSWAASKIHWLDTVANDPALLQGQDIWSVFEEDFLKEFAYPVERAKARNEIKEIKMKGVKLCAYIQDFRELARKALYDLNAPYTIYLFLQGLPPDLVWCCVDRDKLTTFEDWVDAIRRYRTKYRLIGFVLNAKPLSNEEALVLKRAQARVKAAAGDQGIANTQQKVTEDDKILYKREGRCFRCNQQTQMCSQNGEMTSPPIKIERGETQSSLTIYEETLEIRTLSIEERRACVEAIRDNPTLWANPADEADEDWCNRPRRR